MDFFENDLQFTKIIFRDRFYFPPEINASIHDLISYFRANIVSNTPFIYLFAPNHIKTIIAYFAIIKSGHVCVLVEPDIGRLELAEMKQDTPPCALVHIDRVTDTFDYGKEIVFTRDNPQEYDWDELSDVATIVYTNAEDGYAKGAMLTRKNLLANAEAICIGNNIDRNSISFAVAPFSHIFGFQYGIITPLLGNGTTLIHEPAELIGSNTLLHIIVNYKVTHLYSIPLFFYLLSKSSIDLHNQIHSSISGGYKLSQRIRKQFQLNLHIPIYEGYGLTESSGGCLWQKPGVEDNSESVGQPIDGCQVKIHQECIQSSPTNQKGEIFIKGNMIMKGYYQRAKYNTQVLSNGWFHTGDYGKQDKNGNIVFIATKKKMFNIAGKKVYPEEVKRYYLKHNNVANVEFHCEQNEIIGEQYHSVIKLWKDLPDNRSELINWSSSMLSAYKIPKTISFC
jgi:long-chain acyl-CoA synthetase